MNRSEDYSDIPGTYLFDKKACARGYNLNMFFTSLLSEENRKSFLAGETAYLDQYQLTRSQHNAVLERNWLKIIQEGGNIYYMGKLGFTSGLSFEDMAASMTGMTKESYRKMMLSGGRSIDGNRSKAEAGSARPEE